MKSWRLPLGPALALGLLTACGAAPGPVDLPLTLPEAFSAAGEAPRADRWWLAFGEPALDALMGAAFAHNLTLRAAQHRLAQAAAVARRAGAETSPSVEASVGAGVRFPAHRGAEPAFPLGISARYELDLFGRIDAVQQAAVLDAQVSETAVQTTALALAGQVASTYYQLGERQGQLRVLEAQAALNRQVLELLELRFGLGKVGVQDVLRQRQLLESAAGEQARVQADLAVLSHRLAVLQGQAPMATTPPEPTAELPPLPAAGLPAELIQRRPDVVGARLRVEAADRRLAAALADRFPRISLSASATSVHAADIIDNWLVNLGANLVAPLIDGGERAAEVDRTRAATEEALALYGQTVLDALTEVEDALAREHNQQVLIASLDRQLALAAAAVERARERFMVGAISYVDVLDALRTHQGLERSRLTARGDLFQHRIDLYRALAGGLPLEPTSQKGPP